MYNALVHFIKDGCEVEYISLITAKYICTALVYFIKDGCTLISDIYEKTKDKFLDPTKNRTWAAGLECKHYIDCSTRDPLKTIAKKFYLNLFKLK